MRSLNRAHLWNDCVSACWQRYIAWSIGVSVCCRANSRPRLLRLSEQGQTTGSR